MLAIERITSRADGADQVRTLAGIERLAQPPHMHVNGPRVDIRIVRPDCVKQPLARKDTSRMFEKMPEQAKLRRTEWNLLPGTANPVRSNVHFDVSIGELLAGKRRPYSA